MRTKKTSWSKAFNSVYEQKNGEKNNDKLQYQNTQTSISLSLSSESSP
jgi:hypothetical protein